MAKGKGKGKRQRVEPTLLEEIQFNCGSMLVTAATELVSGEPQSTLGTLVIELESALQELQDLVEAYGEDAVITEVASAVEESE